MIKMITGLLLTASLMMALSFGTKKVGEEKKGITSGGKFYQIIMGTASKTSTYNTAGGKLINHIKGASIANTDGSLQNFELLKDGHINAAIMQKDAYNLQYKTTAGLTGDWTMIDLDRAEHVSIFGKKGLDEDDLQKKGTKVCVGFESSGSAASFRNMILLEPAYGKSSYITSNDDSKSATMVANLLNGNCDAVVVTTSFQPSDGWATRVRTNDEIEFIDIDDKDLNDEVDIGGKKTQVYNFEKVSANGGMFGSVKGLKTSSVLVIRTDLMNSGLADKLINRALQQKAGLFER